MKNLRLKEHQLRKIIKSVLIKEIDVGSGVELGFKNVIGGGSADGDENDLPSLANVDLEKISMPVAGKNAAELLRF